MYKILAPTKLPLSNPKAFFAINTDVVNSGSSISMRQEEVFSISIILPKSCPFSSIANCPSSIPSFEPLFIIARCLQLEGKKANTLAPIKSIAFSFFSFSALRSFYFHLLDNQTV